ncbi:amino-acid N-acetyltransferase [Microdochium nivale]|nr:amino-acid N-acetyltransferase [Microdochium nivale]
MPYTSLSKTRKQKESADQDFFVSILETSVTKRDAKGYMNKFVPLLDRKNATVFKQRAAHTRPSGAGSLVPGWDSESGVASNAELETTPRPTLYVALVKFRAPQLADDATVMGVGKTLAQLNKLGLMSIVLVDCDMKDADESVQRQVTTAQAARIGMAIDEFDDNGSRIIQSPLLVGNSLAESDTALPCASSGLFVSNDKSIAAALSGERIPIIPSFACTVKNPTIKVVNGNDAMLALTRSLSGLQFLGTDEASVDADARLPTEVYRLIILDPLGGIPASNRATGRHLFLNLAHEFPEVEADLASKQKNTLPPDECAAHLANATLAKHALSMLPPTSSAVITTPQEVSRERSQDALDWALVGTRRGQNPLIHNLLTDKPVQSSSLPSGRFTPVTSSMGIAQIGSITTLAKRGMPLTILPNPLKTPWRPPQPGQRSLNLTDPCIDLGRLVYLIEDSFGRKLDVDHYLKRVQDNLAGVIIAGEYEGCAILTWESPEENAGSGAVKEPARLVPYLDKFAVLRKSQGAGGVADIVFNAMVRDCFPEGVCWRSRKDNPVNKWYFERSKGTLKIPDMNWTMFWTTPDLGLHKARFGDYERVCRGIAPSWADKKHIND